MAKVTMTPERAQELLARNTYNRKLRPYLVRKYAKEMTEGRWRYNGSPIVIADDGTLLDGQHRLAACSQSGVPFDVEVVEGISKDVMPTIDAGSKRSASDAILLQGYALGYAPGVAAAARLILNYLDGISMNSTVSSAAIADIVAKNEDIAEWFVIGRKTVSILPPAPTGAILFLGTRDPTMRKRAMAFVDGVASGAELRSDDPRLALRKAFLETRRVSGNASRPNPYWSMPMIAKSWNAWVTATPMEQIQIRSVNGAYLMPDVLGGPKLGEGLGAPKPGNSLVRRRAANASAEVVQ